MKKIASLVLALIIVSGCSKNYAPAIAAALNKAHEICQTSNVYDPLTNGDVLLAKIGGHKAQPKLNTRKTCERIADSMRSVDVSQCPEDFREAWINTVHDFENFNPAQSAANTVAATATGYAAAKSGSKSLGDVTAQKLTENSTLNDITHSLEGLESIAIKYNVRFN